MKCLGLVSHFKLSLGGQTEWSPLVCDLCCRECGPPTVGPDTFVRTSLNLRSAILESTLLQALGWALWWSWWKETLMCFSCCWIFCGLTHFAPCCEPGHFSSFVTLPFIWGLVRNREFLFCSFMRSPSSSSLDWLYADTASPCHSGQNNTFPPAVLLSFLSWM